MWKPTPQLTPPRGARVTIIFVNTLHQFYKTQSLDPIFPASDPSKIKPLFIHKDPRARAVACVDETFHCTPDGETCWTFADQEKHPVPISRPEYHFMNYSLLYSNMFTSLELRLRTALLAQKNVSQYISPGLEEDHWKREMENLFNTSLARIQLDALSIASGEGRGLDGFVRQLPEKGSGLDICRLFKFRPVGYVNVLVWPYILIAVVPVLAWVLSLDVPLARSSSETQPGTATIEPAGEVRVPSRTEILSSAAGLSASAAEGEGQSLPPAEATEQGEQSASSTSLVPNLQQTAQQIQPGSRNGDEEGDAQVGHMVAENTYYEDVIVLTAPFYPATWRWIGTKLGGAYAAVKGRLRWVGSKLGNAYGAVNGRLRRVFGR
jgi:hypothetical protein